jgi:TolA-binding protein
VNDEKICSRLLNEGRDFFREGRFQDALEKFSQLLMRRPQSVAALYWVAVTNYHLGNLPEAKNYA